MLGEGGSLFLLSVTLTSVLIVMFILGLVDGED